MAVSTEAWRLAGAAAVHQLHVLAEDKNRRKKKARPAPIAMLGFEPGKTELVRLMGSEDPPRDAQLAAREAGAHRSVMAADARINNRVDALVLFLVEGDDTAEATLAYNLPFQVVEADGLPTDGPERQAFVEGLQSGRGWTEVRPLIGPVLEGTAVAVAPPSESMAPTEDATDLAVTAQFDDFRIRNGVVERLKDNGEVRAFVPLGDGVRAELVEKRQIAVGVALLVLTLGGTAALWGCGGLWGLGCAALPALLVGGIGIYAFFKHRYLQISHGDETEEWACTAEFGDPGLQAFVAAINRGAPADEGADSRPEEADAFGPGIAWYFTQPPPDAPDAGLVGSLDTVGEGEDLASAHTILRAFVGANGMDATLYAIAQHLGRTRFVAYIPMDGKTAGQVRAWTRGQPVIGYAGNGRWLDDQLRVLATLDGEHVDPDAQIPYPADAIARRVMTETDLAMAGLRGVPVPPVIGTQEVQLRPASEVAERALALAMIVSPLASGAAMGGELPSRDELLERFGPLVDALSPSENAFLDAPDAEAGHQLSWRLEAAATLLWALGWLKGRLSFAAQVDGKEIIDAIRAQGDDLPAAVASASLRSTDEILDLLDQTYCRRWIVVQSRLENTEPPDGLHPGILMERHCALNWLTGFNNGIDVAWDDVEVPT